MSRRKEKGTVETQGFTETSGAIARAAGVSVPTIRTYTDLGLLPFVKASNGTRLFKPDAADEVGRILAKRLANRGHKRAA
jgi:DNA-binding transcriptional MerR regulator